VLRAVEAPSVAGEVINIATGGRTSLNELLRLMNLAVGTALRPIYQPAREGDVRDSQADIGKAARLLDYAPGVALDEGLSRTLAWCRETSRAAER
jgi:nucleoside-diphosphate-sugar epimerase